MLHRSAGKYNFVFESRQWRIPQTNTEVTLQNVLTISPSPLPGEYLDYLSVVKMTMEWMHTPDIAGFNGVDGGWEKD